MEANTDFEPEAKILSGYYKNGSRSIWLREGKGGSVYTEISSFRSLMEVLHSKKGMFEGIPIVLIPFNTSGEKFEITIQNDKERVQLISQLQSFQFKESSDKITAHELEEPFSKISEVKKINYNPNNQKLEIMKNNPFESKKADLQVKINLPGQQKPFFDKMSTPANLTTQIQKAGQKLEEKESLRININGASFEIPKEKTEKGNILETVQSEYEKAQKNNIQAKEETDNEEAKRTESQQNEAPAKQKEKTNFGYLKDQIKYLGMGEDPAMHKELAKKTGSGVKEFSMVITSDKASFKNSKVEFTLNFQKSSANNKVYLNTFLATLKNEEKNTELTHTFSANGRITAKEAINLLEGRSVKTEINSKHSDEKEDAFIKLQLGEEKNEKGNFKLQVFNKNYGIDVERIMAKSKLVFDDEKHKEITQKSLEKGNIVSVKFSDQNNKVTEGKAILNPQYKMLNLYDSKMKRVNSNEQAFQKDNSETKEVKNQQNYSRKM
ncbi:hypothetical protein HNP38_002553 [Chryseobacterium defluvii]|uniref:DUF3945 domain-containing protein n=1 Tax=Chryseobacterium defluvii TaxID=160396 RepID=A0A840KCQ0_9FLAO|nr:hypothetical protein [Chryseobacterium defluvii]MBB4807249.1 hypothetical protein [Chryseobacterium defluvii]